MSAAGNDEAQDQLEWLQWTCWEEIKKNIKSRAMAGKKSSRFPPIRTLLEMADFAIPLLRSLSKSQLQNLKDCASNRWTWPSLIHLCKREQTKYELLASKIELGGNIKLNINPSRTNGDYIFTVAAHAIYSVTQFEPDMKTGVHTYLRWFRGHGKRFQNMKQEIFQGEAKKFLRGIGRFTRENFPNWKPVFETFLTMRHGPFKERLRLLNIQLDDDSIQEMRSESAYKWLKKHRSKNLDDDKKFSQVADFYDLIKGLIHNVTV
jgi:hypothetical protein